MKTLNKEEQVKFIENISGGLMGMEEDVIKSIYRNLFYAELKRYFKPYFIQVYDRYHDRYNNNSCIEVSIGKKVLATVYPENSTIDEVLAESLENLRKISVVNSYNKSYYGITENFELEEIYDFGYIYNELNVRGNEIYALSIENDVVTFDYSYSQQRGMFALLEFIVNGKKSDEEMKTSLLHTSEINEIFLKINLDKFDVTFKGLSVKRKYKSKNIVEVKNLTKEQQMKFKRMYQMLKIFGI